MSPGNDNGSGVTNQPTSRWNGRFSITVTLVTAIGLLTLISVGGILGIGVWLAQKNTFSLLSANAHQVVTAEVTRIEQHLMPAQHQARFLAERIAAGDVDPADRKRLGDLMIGALAAAPQIETVMFINARMQSYFANYDPAAGKVSLQDIDYSSDPIVRERVAKLESGANWGPAIWRESQKKTYLNVAYPVSVKDEHIGAEVAVVSVEQLSQFVNEGDSDAVGRRFILSGRNHVLAHPLMASGYPGRTDKDPLPGLSGFGDPVLAAIWRREDGHGLRLNMPEGTEGHVVHMDSGRFIFIFREIHGFGPKPLIAGVYFREFDVGEEVRRMIVAMVAGILALIASLVAAIYIGRNIARPIVRFSAAAGRIRDLDISQVADLPGSVFRELNDQSASFNAMLRALRWFELYVPKKFVAQLVKRGDVREMISDARNITVMFTDIANFPPCPRACRRMKWPPWSTTILP